MGLDALLWMDLAVTYLLDFDALQRRPSVAGPPPIITMSAYLVCSAIFYMVLRVFL